MATLALPSSVSTALRAACVIHGTCDSLVSLRHTQEDPLTVNAGCSSTPSRWRGYKRVH